MLKITKASGDGRWFAYQEGVEIKIRPLTGTILRDLRKQAAVSRMELDPKTRRMIPVEDIDEDKMESILADYLIEDWKGIGDDEGNPMAVTQENKHLVLDQPLIRDFVWGAAQSLDIIEEREKN